MKLREWLRYYGCRREFSTKCSRLALTYANRRHVDGAGAQLQRVYGIYALSRFLNVMYVHSPLTRIQYQGLAALEGNFEDAGIVDRYNRAFALPSDVDVPERHEVREIDRFDIRTAVALRREAERSKTFIVARFSEPYRIIDTFPEAYRLARGSFPALRGEPAAPLRIALHVRRGELLAVARERMLPNGYYLAAARRMTELLDRMGRSYVVELYTELGTKPFVVTPEHHAMKNGVLLQRPTEIGPEMNRIEDFDALPNLRRFINTDPIETLQRMSTAHVLVMSRSSFSYLAALFKPRGVVGYHPFRHSPLRDWLRIDAAGRFSARRFRRQIEENFPASGRN